MQKKKKKKYTYQRCDESVVVHAVNGNRRSVKKLLFVFTYRVRNIRYYTSKTILKQQQPKKKKKRERKKKGQALV